MILESCRPTVFPLESRMNRVQWLVRGRTEKEGV